MKVSESMVTVFALCYNHDRYVLDTLDSIITQTYQNIQLIIIDNGSKDDSVVKINNWIEKSEHGNVIFLPEEKNIGICPALNKALALSVGEYFQFISCDDVLLTNKLFLQIGLFENLPKTVAFIYGNFKYINENGLILEDKNTFEKNGWNHQSDLPSGRIKLLAANTYFISAPTVLYRTACLKEIGGYDEAIPFEDFQMNLRLLDKFSCFGFIDVVCHYRVLSTSFYNSTSDSKIERNYLHTMKYMYGDYYYQNWVIILRYILFGNSLKLKIMKAIIFKLLNSATKSFKKEFGMNQSNKSNHESDKL